MGICGSKEPKNSNPPGDQADVLRKMEEMQKNQEEMRKLLEEKDRENKRQIEENKKQMEENKKQMEKEFEERIKKERQAAMREIRRPAGRKLFKIRPRRCCRQRLAQRIQGLDSCEPRCEDLRAQKHCVGDESSKGTRAKRHRPSNAASSGGQAQPCSDPKEA